MAVAVVGDRGLARWGRWAAVVLLAGGLSACGTVYNSGSDSFWNDAGFWEGGAGDAAMAALAKGDFVQAESLGTQAMQRNPRDPYALLALAVVYENTGRRALARQYYEVLVSMNPQATALIGFGPTAERRTIADIAQQHLTLLSDGAKAAAGSGAVAPPPPISAVDLGGSDDANVITRFQTLRQLLDEALITRDEYNLRRGANLGALLPYTAPAPAAGLGRPAPQPDQVVQRMRYLAAAYQEKSMTAREQMAERSAILDALLPAVPRQKADPPPPVTEPLRAAELSGRLEKLYAANVITAAEQSREKAAVYQAVATYQANAEAAARAAAGMAPALPARPSGPGVRLASYSSEAQAQRAWAALQKAHPDQLGTLQPVITRVSLRRHRVAYRLEAGPVTDRKAALAVCRSLRSSRQSCQPTVLP